MSEEEIEKLKTYTDEQIEQMDIKELKKKFKEIQSIAENGQYIITLLNTVSTKCKIALFMVIRNSTILPTGTALRKTDYEINRLSYKAMQELLKMIDFERAEKMYKEGASNE